MAQRKGAIAIQSLNNRLRLQWTWAKSKGGDGGRYWLTLELDDDPVNRAQAQLKAQLIQRDIESGHFDATLNKYRPNLSANDDRGVSELFEQFLQYKKLTLRKTSLEKYEALRKHVEQFFGNKPVDQITPNRCGEFRDWLLKRQKPLTAYERLGMLAACFEWAKLPNPCKTVLDAFEVPPQQEPEPFTREEVRRIIQAFISDPEYSFYSDLVQWLFGVGCRFGEAAALQWKHLNHNCSEVWIGEAIGRDKARKSTKNRKVRRFELAPHLQQMLLNRRATNYNPEDLVFPSRRAGRAISDRTFSDRAWGLMLQKAGVAYRKPYSTRHTFVSHSLMAGQNPLEVCEITGHTKETMFEFYARFAGKAAVRVLYWD